MNTTVALISIPLNTVAAVLLWRLPETVARVIAFFNMACVGWNLMVIWRALA